MARSALCRRAIVGIPHCCECGSQTASTRSNLIETKPQMWPESNHRRLFAAPFVSPVRVPISSAQSLRAHLAWALSPAGIEKPLGRCQKGYQTTLRNPVGQRSELRGHLAELSQCQKGWTPRLQGLDVEEMPLLLFAFRPKKRLK